MIKHIQKIPKSIYLFISIIMFIFAEPIIALTPFKSYINLILYSFIFLATFSVIEKKTAFLKVLLYFGLAQNIFLVLIESSTTSVISFGISAIIFLIITFILIMQIAKSKQINNNVIFDAINGYLLIGVVATLLNSVLLIINPDAINFNGDSNSYTIIYYSYITLTTIGFGDFSPQSTIARSLSVFIGLSGQLYLTIIIAFIVGKVSNANNS